MLRMSNGDIYSWYINSLRSFRNGNGMSSTVVRHTACYQVVRKNVELCRVSFSNNTRALKAWSFPHTHSPSPLYNFTSVCYLGFLVLDQD